MKIWLKYLLGCIIGIAAAFIIPAESELFNSAMSYISTLTINMGRYALVPLLFFTMTVAVYELYEEKKIFSIAIRTTLFTVISTIFLTILGILIVLIANPSRIPISVEVVSQRISLNIGENILKLFPVSGFASLIDGVFLLPIYVLAGFAGAGCAAEKTEAKQTLSLFYSLSRICYSVMNFFIDILAIGMIGVSAYWMLTLLESANINNFLFFLLVIAGTFIVIVCLLLPLFLKIFLKEPKPFAVLYSALASIIAALFSGDANFTLAVNLRHAEGSLGVKRKLNVACMPVLSTFARGGTALVTAAAFIVVLKSYSSLGVSITDFLWIFVMAAGVSFFLGALPSGGVFFSLMILCTMYGRGFETGYLILRPVAFFLGTVATAIDAAIAFFGTYYIAKKNEMIAERETSFYI